MKISPLTLLGVNIYPVRLTELLTFIEQSMKRGSKFRVFYLNIHGANLACEIPAFRNHLNQAEMVFCDGIGLKLGARFIGLDLPERMTPPDWIHRMCQICVANDYSIYLLGSQNKVLEKTKAALLESNPGLKIAGAHHGYFDKRKKSEENKLVIEDINRAKPDILLVGFGMPLQEQWITENYENLNAKMFFAVGAMFDYVAGDIARVPRWLTEKGLEWFGRLIVEPRRLWHRYLIGIPKFFFNLVKHKVGRPLA